MNVAYYISGHGFGHISRSYEVVKYLQENAPIEKLFINTTRKDFVKDKTDNLIFREVTVDVGMVQLSSISLNVEKTLESILEFEKNKNSLIESELAFLETEKIGCIISDSSSLPFLLADKLSLPSFFIGNFTWDFIYDNYTKDNSYFGSYANILKKEYSLCHFGLILPFHCPMNSIPRKKEIGIIGRRSLEDRQTVRDRIGFTDKNRYFLFSFGAYGISDSLGFENLKDNEWIVVSGYEGLIGEKVIDVKNIYYPDLLKACDFVLTKPGYGILSESYLANTPVIYTDRGDFAEYPYLVDALDKFHFAAFLPQSDLLSFQLEKAVLEIEKQKIRKKVPTLLDGRKEILEQIF